MENEPKKLRLLVSDDSKLLRKKLRAELEALGCEVIEAENGKEAIMKDLKDKPDGIILDIVMPEVGGIEALQVIKEVSRRRSRWAPSTSSRSLTPRNRSRKQWRTSAGRPAKNEYDRIRATPAECRRA